MNEKLIEMLFTYYALRYLDGCGVTVYAPSSRAEYITGYDAKLMSANGFDELYLQFKGPRFLKRKKWRYGIFTTQHQHTRLQCYPFNTAYYVAHTFRDVAQIQRAQYEWTNPADFLKRYVAIEIRRLEDNVKFFRYSADRADFVPHEVYYNLDTDAHPRKATHEVDGDRGGWMNGEELLRCFCEGNVGARVRLEGWGMAVAPPAPDAGIMDDRLMEHDGLEPWDLPHDSVVQMADVDQGKDWGVALRRNIVPRRATPQP